MDSISRKWINMTRTEYDKIEKGDSLLYARVMPELGYYEIHDVRLVTKQDDYCSVTDGKSKQMFLFIKNDIFTRLYLKRVDALNFLKEQKEKYKDVKVLTDEE